MAARPRAELHSPGLRRPRLCWLLLAAALAGVPAAADYPRIAELASRDVLYRQLQQDLQSYFRWVSRQQAKTVAAGQAGAGAELPPLRLFSYRNDGSLDLFALAARLNLPYDTLATLNGLANPAALAERPVVLVPNLPGLFVRQSPAGSFEEILYSVSLAQRDGAQSVRVLEQGEAQSFRFYRGEAFSSVERAFFLNILFRFPVAFARLSSAYGIRDNPFTGEREFHRGLDLAAPEGTEVYAARDGVVVSCDADPVLGNLVVIEHEAGYQTVYGHLRRIAVGLRQPVRSGTIVGEVGTTGLSTGPHLHFEVRRRGAARDPGQLLPLPEDEG